MLLALSSQVYYRIWVDDTRVLRVENTRPEMFKNVKVFAGDLQHVAADATYKNLVWKSSWDKCEALSCPLIQVTGHGYGGSNGEYRAMSETLPQARHRPLYKHVDKDR